MEVSDLSGPAHDLLCFHTVGRGLDRPVTRPDLFGKGLLNLTDGRLTARPKRIHDLKFEFRQFRSGHLPSNMCVSFYNTCLCTVKSSLKLLHCVGLCPDPQSL